MSDSTVEDAKEKFLRAEINSLAERMHRLFQWGVTLLLSLETALFFVRKEAAERAGLPTGSPFPIGRHLWGSGVILFLAVIFICLHRGLGKLYKQYFRQLYPAKDSPSSSGITPPNVKWGTKWALDLVMIAFPIFDLSIGLSNYYFPLHPTNNNSTATTTQVQNLPLSITVTIAQPQTTPSVQSKVTSPATLTSSSPPVKTNP